MISVPSLPLPPPHIHTFPGLLLTLGVAQFAKVRGFKSKSRKGAIWEGVSFVMPVYVRGKYPQIFCVCVCVCVRARVCACMCV